MRAQSRRRRPSRVRSRSPATAAASGTETFGITPAEVTLATESGTASGTVSGSASGSAIPAQTRATFAVVAMSVDLTTAVTSRDVATLRAVPAATRATTATATVSASASGTAVTRTGTRVTCAICAMCAEAGTRATSGGMAALRQCTRRICRRLLRRIIWADPLHTAIPLTRATRAEAGGTPGVGLPLRRRSTRAIRAHTTGATNPDETSTGAGTRVAVTRGMCAETRARMHAMSVETRATTTGTVATVAAIIASTLATCAAAAAAAATPAIIRETFDGTAAVGRPMRVDAIGHRTGARSTIATAGRATAGPVVTRGWTRAIGSGTPAPTRAIGTMAGATGGGMSGRST
jgi:hypothetical protein